MTPEAGNSLRSSFSGGRRLDSFSNRSFLTVHISHRSMVSILNCEFHFAARQVSDPVLHSVAAGSSGLLQSGQRFTPIVPVFRSS
jgi:hypothetical protein